MSIITDYTKDYWLLQITINIYISFYVEAQFLFQTCTDALW